MRLYCAVGSISRLHFGNDWQPSEEAVIFSQFVDDGIATPEQLEQVECPVGLDIQAVSVQEIAVSVVARLVQRRANLRRALGASI